MADSVAGAGRTADDAVTDQIIVTSTRLVRHSPRLGTESA